MIVKCPKCERNHPKKEGRNCTCGYYFVFHPDEDGGLTDGRFASWIRAAGNNGTYFFTKNQLYATHIRRTLRKGRIGRIIMNVIIVIMAIIVTLSATGVLFESDSGPSGFFIFLLAASIFIRIGLRKKKTYSIHEFDQFLRRWVQRNPEEKLLTKTRLHEPPPEWKEPDIYDYGAQRILVVENDLLVDLFVLNGFHAQESAIVVSEDGYPSYIAARVKQVVQENPDIPVYYLHDALPADSSSIGLGKARTLTGKNNVIDVGLFTDDVKKMPALKMLPESEWKGKTPVDAIVFGSLSLMLAAAVAGGLTLGAVAAAAAAESGSDGGGGYG